MLTLFLILNATAVDDFHTLRDRLVKEWLQDQPQWGRQVGMHDYDGQIMKTAELAIREREARLQKEQAQLAAIDDKNFNADDKLDLGLLRYQVANDLFTLVSIDAPHKRPSFYESLFAVDSYINLDYAPLAERARRLVAHEEAALAEAPNVTKNLTLPLPKPIAETAVKIYAGYASYLRGDVAKLIGGAGDAALQKRFAAANEKLAAEAQRISDWLAQKAVPTGDASYVLGAKRYLALIEAQEGLKTTLPAFKKMAEDNLLQNRLAFEKLQPQVTWTRPTAQTLLPAARKLVAESRQFIIDKKIVTLATPDTAEVAESPPYMRWNSAFLNPSGPFDTVRRAFYYITLPDPSWSKKEQEEYIPANGVLLSTTIHEVYPGHFVQGRWVERAPTQVQKLVGSYSYIEGWAHYIEQMMIEEGYHANDKEGQLGQLSDALLRNCRFVVSIGVHTEGLSLSDAEKRFRDECHQDAATAREQAVRATFDPGYFAYTVGKLEILALRAEAKKRLGARFSLQRFHDALLSHGAAPVPLLRERVLSELEGK
jgi:uncharacterized protein (DUF885 family)